MLIDLSFMERLLPNLASALNVAPSTLLFYIGITVTAANIASKMIPDTATGWLKTVKQICAFIGAHVENRIAPGITATAVVKEVVGEKIDEVTQDTIRDMAKGAEALIPETVNESAEEVREIIRDPFGAAAERILTDLSDEEGK